MEQKRNFENTSIPWTENQTEFLRYENVQNDNIYIYILPGRRRCIPVNIACLKDANGPCLGVLIEFYHARYTRVSRIQFGNK